MKKFRILTGSGGFKGAKKDTGGRGFFNSISIFEKKDTKI
jgi:hypothetical protein